MQLLTKWRYMTALTALGLVAAACGPGSAGNDTNAEDADPAQATQETGAAEEDPEDFDLDQLIADAQAEGELTVFDGSGRITIAAEAFEEKYGIAVDGVKASNVEQVELVTRQVDAGNVEVSLINIQDGPTIEAVLLQEGYVESWVPPDRATGMDPAHTDPTQILYSSRVFGYNTEAHGDQCPVSNVWQLTEDEYSGLQLSDPLAFPETLDWFSYIVTAEADGLEAAYEDHFGEPLETDEENAGWEWLKRVAQNDPVVRPDDQDALEAIGATGQDAPPFGLYHLSKLRDIEELGLASAPCLDAEPFAGYSFPKYSLLVSDAPSPNAAKLFLHFLLTEEGTAPWVAEAVGNFSTHEDVPANENDPIGSVSEWQDRTSFLDPSHNDTAWELRDTVRDFWVTHLG